MRASVIGSVAASPPGSASAFDDPRVVRAVQEYLAQAEAGGKPSRAEFVARYPDIAEPLDRCLAGLEFVQAAAPHLSRPLDGVAPTDGDGAVTGTLGDFRILREVGRGGMGIVYEAEQISLGRRVALKVLPFAATMDPRHLQRFHNEAKAAACLHHTNIVPVHAVGSERGVHFYAMQFIDGQPLSQVIHQLRQEESKPADSPAAKGEAEAEAARTTAYPAPAGGPTASATTRAGGGPTPLTGQGRRGREYYRKVAELGVQAAEALEHAHQVGIVHRDVKPGNLLIDGRGQVWVTDFGLAQVRQGEAGLTLTGEMLGTVRYMSPEQALAKRVVIDHRTDVYSLGATLYELLTLRPVFEGNDRQELLRQVAFEEPLRLRKLEKGIPAELETIVLKALEKRAQDRYATAKELADDLRCWLLDQPIRARRPSLLQRLRKWARRHRAIMGVAAAAFALALLSLVVSTVLIAAAYQAEAGARQKAEKAGEREAGQRRLAEREAEKGQRLLYLTRMSLAYQAWRAGKIKRCRELLDAYLPHPGQPDRRGWEWHYIRGLCRGELFTLGGPQGNLAGHYLWSLAWSPDGRRLAAAVGLSDGKDAIEPKKPGRVLVWDAASGRVIHDLHGHPWFALASAWSPDSRRLATGCFHGEVRIWDADNGKQLRALPREENGAILRLTWSPDGKFLAAWAGDIIVWDAATGKEWFRVAQKQASFTMELYWSPDGTQLAVAEANLDRNQKEWTITLWSIAERKPGTTLRGPTANPWTGGISGVYTCAWAPDGKHLASTNFDRTVRVWDVTKGKEVCRLPVAELGPWLWAGPWLAWSPNGRRLAALDAGRSIHLWEDLLDRTRGPREFRLQGHTDKITSLGWSPDGRRLASTGGDTTIRVWDTAGQELFALRGHERPVAAALWSRDGRRLASISQSSIKVWDAETPDVVRLSGHRGPALSVSWAPNSRHLVSAGKDGQVRVVDLVTGRHLRTLAGHGGSDFYEPWVWGPVGRRLAGPGPDNAVRVWDLDNPAGTLTLRGHTRLVYGVAWSPDGRRLAAGGQGTAVRVWDLSGSGRLAQTLNHHSAELYAVAWSPDGRRLASVSAKELVVWDGESGRFLFQRPCANGSDHFVAWSPDSRLLAYKGPDNSITVWDVKRNALDHTFQHPGVRCAAYSPDGTRLVSAGDADGSLVFWDLVTGQEIFTLKALDEKVMHLAWSKDGRRLALAGENGAVGILDASPPGQRWPSLAASNSRLAWFLATTPEGGFREPARATELARNALAQGAEDGPESLSWYRTVLGVARYRAGDVKGAVEVLERATRGIPGDGTSLFFLAMAHWKHGNKDEAHRWYGKAVQWMDKNKPQDEELARFRAEAATLLGIKIDPGSWRATLSKKASAKHELLPQPRTEISRQP
jgi:WD40 repeat protein/serine/threonine protein kinase